MSTGVFPLPYEEEMEDIRLVETARARGYAAYRRSCDGRVTFLTEEEYTKLMGNEADRV